MMPVHSHQGGRKAWAPIKIVFLDGQQILSKGGIIVFFPESYSHIEHQLLPFRKGVFRLAFDTAAASNFSFDIPIVPIGITYDHPVACRTDVQVHAGKALLLSDYKEEYHQNAAAALLHICKDAHQATSKLVCILQKEHACKQRSNIYLSAGTINEERRLENCIREKLSRTTYLSCNQPTPRRQNYEQTTTEPEPILRRCPLPG